MYPGGMFGRKPEKEKAMKKLRVHVAMFGAWVAVVRVAPYLLHYFSSSDTLTNNHLTLDF